MKFSFKYLACQQLLILGFQLKETMIVGYDLYHDSTLKGKTVGACVSTYDKDFTEFFSQTRPHENPTQLGNNLMIFIRSET